MAGIVSVGAYVPWSRLDRQAAVAALSWFNAGLKGKARGERAFADWDEDSITMAVEAGRDCVGEAGRSAIRGIIMASTSLPNADRQNAGIVKEALNLDDAVRALDVTGSQRAGTSALIAAFDAASGGDQMLCLASEHRAARPGSEAELGYGDAAAALLVGPEPGIAELVGHHSRTIDFVDHFRATGEAYDYEWEARWVRDEGYLKIVPAVIAQALDAQGLVPGEVDCFVMGVADTKVAQAIAAAAGIAPEAVQDTLQNQLGHAGCAHPLVMLAHALEKAEPGQLILLASFGQGCDILLLRVTDAIAARRPDHGLSKWLGRRRPETNYTRFLHLTGAMPLDGGMRAEADQRTSPTLIYRDRKTLLALVGGKCRETGTVQFPKSDISVAQNHRAIGTQDDYPLAEKPARIATFTADSLVYSPNPPGCYGLIEFQGGGRMTVDFTDVDPKNLKVGQNMRMMFRIKRNDTTRQFIHYFWKAAPDYSQGAL